NDPLKPPTGYRDISVGSLRSWVQRARTSSSRSLWRSEPRRHCWVWSAVASPLGGGVMGSEMRNAAHGDGGYAGLLKGGGSPGIFAAVFVGSLPLGMLPVGLVLAVQSWTGSFGAAGLAAAGFSGGNAVGLIVQGWAIDRFGARRTSSVTAVLFVGTVTLFIAFGNSGASSTLFLSAVVLSGVFLPEITTAARSWLARSSFDAPTRVAGYALLGACFQGGIVLGPLLVSSLFHPKASTTPLVAGSVMALLGVGIYLWASFRSDDSAHGDGGARPSESARRVPAGGLGRILLIAALTGAPGGVLVVIAPRAAHVNGSVAVAGILLAALAAGEVLSSLGFGLVHARLSARVQLVVALTASSVAFIVAAIASPSVWLLTGAFLLIGITAGPSAVLLSSMTEAAVAPKAIGRASGTRISLTLLSTAAGSAVAGAVPLPLGFVLAFTALPFLAAAVVAGFAGVKHR
ncbi:MFS transporter, partial [Curtobacterium sp. ISL-83]|uniref:MFS transporter n=1 Tax=Curtobacterium sp. ISL-83 TaxID=2819145 RepID=UPI001BE55C1D